jgi:predicted GH43/DUF377 family glycosyl hydrolase
VDALPVHRHDEVRLLPDAGRVLAKPFLPGSENLPDGGSRIDAIVRRVLAMPEAEVSTTLADAREAFAGRHGDLEQVLETHYGTVAEVVAIPDDASRSRRLLIGAYFTHEFSVEAAALGNPSIVAAPDQSGLAPGETRFVMSLRAIGEGHLSSIEFRSGVVAADRTIRVEAPVGPLETGARVGADYDKDFFETKLDDLGALDAVARSILDDLAPRFTRAELETAIVDRHDRSGGGALSVQTRHILHWLASSNYHVRFSAGSDLSQRVVFPAGPAESRGMEDLRLVRFVHDDGRTQYYGTYTAFDGHQILPQLVETADFRSFRIATLSGESAQNKGMALFPRKLDGHFVALGRHDNVNNFLMRSDDVRVWREAEKIQEPERSWELTQLGNCGSPLETEAGWLVITHGVGPFRQYSLGALLLDIADPARVIGHLDDPLLVPRGPEREGYVPNVVYSCGSMIVGGELVLPYGFADTGASIASVPIDDLLGRLLPA